MPNIVPVNTTALPKSSRRAALDLFAGLSALVTTPVIVRAATSPAISVEDAELFALAEPIAAADAALEAVNEVHSVAEDVFLRPGWLTLRSLLARTYPTRTGSRRFRRRQQKPPNAGHRQNGLHTKRQ
jgi:hypothetical protein